MKIFSDSVMSIDPTPSSTVYRRQSSSKSNKDKSSNHNNNNTITTRTLSMAEENSGDTLTDLNSLPYMPQKANAHKRHRRFSELKPLPNSGREIERRNSTPLVHLGALLPNAFRLNRHHHRNSTKDDLNTSTDTLNSTFSLLYNESMTSRNDGLSSSRIIGSNINGLRDDSLGNSELSLMGTYENSLQSTLFTHAPPGKLEPQSADTVLFKLNTSLCVSEIYREHFLQSFHMNYCGELQNEGAFLASVKYLSKKSDPSPNSQARAIIRTSSQNYDVSISIDETHDDNVLPLLIKQAQLSTIQTFKPTSHLRSNEKIYAFDKCNDERQNCKIGCLYQRIGQREESDIFNNDDLSSEMTDFLQILADLVRLKGFDKCRGDLDTKNDFHGEYSYYTQYQNHEMMFNVAPMIPSTRTDGQCVKRKGLVANSFVCIVFQEGDTPFIPDFISGKVTQIYITVQPMIREKKLHYKIDIWHRNELTSLIDPPGGIIENDASFRDYFLTLLLNSIHVATESPSLRFRIAEQRQRLRQEDFRKLLQTVISNSNMENSLELENNHNHHSAPPLVEQRSFSRTDSVTTQSTSDTAISDSGRVSPAAPVKKRTLSKIFSVFSSRSGSLSTTGINETPPVTPITPETYTLSSPPIQLAATTTTKKETVKRTASIKQRPAPSPPVSSRAPISYKYGLNASTLPHTASHSNVLKLSNQKNDNTTSNHYLDTHTFEETMRSRSNSTPGDTINIMTQRSLSEISAASKNTTDSSSSSIDDTSDSEFSEEDKLEHRSTLTEPHSQAIQQLRLDHM